MKKTFLSEFHSISSFIRIESRGIQFAADYLPQVIFFSFITLNKIVHKNVKIVHKNVKIVHRNVKIVHKNVQLLVKDLKDQSSNTRLAYKPH